MGTAARGGSTIRVPCACPTATRSLCKPIWPGIRTHPGHLDIRDTCITWMGSLPHSRNSQVDAWNEGRHDGWIEAKRSGQEEYADLPLTMGHYIRKICRFITLWRMRLRFAARITAR